MGQRLTYTCWNVLCNFPTLRNPDAIIFSETDPDFLLPGASEHMNSELTISIFLLSWRMALFCPPGILQTWPILKNGTHQSIFEHPTQKVQLLRQWRLKTLVKVLGLAVDYKTQRWKYGIGMIWTGSLANMVKRPTHGYWSWVSFAHGPHNSGPE